ncbi:hypothetical protein SDC9_210356 [bioreactor metagenome]|uniref:Uncharacterized protein n=1 Tax=bioreactor metagenome TaxID=1076179 RepID=A0A645JQV6_9ZZZZ
MFIYLIFFNQTWEYNYPFKLIQWIDNCKSTTQDAILGAMTLALLTSLVKICEFVWYRFVPSDKMKEKLKTLRKELNDKYK